jgi:ATP phosphoribosyltransferase
MALTIALPKGRLGEDTEKLMLSAGIITTPVPRDSRKLIFEVGGGFEIILVRAWDVPTYVESGTADIGICGKDDLLEHGADVLELLDLGFGFCRMTVAAKNEISRDELLSRQYLRVATKYPNIARRYFGAVSIQAEIVKLYGSVELAAVTGMSDCIVDLVSTGGTLRENGLHVVEDIFDSTARLVLNRAAYYRSLDKVDAMVERMRAALSSEK